MFGFLPGRQLTSGRHLQFPAPLVLSTDSALRRTSIPTTGTRSRESFGPSPGFGRSFILTLQRVKNTLTGDFFC